MDLEIRTHRSYISIRGTNGNDQWLHLLRYGEWAQAWLWQYQACGSSGCPLSTPSFRAWVGQGWTETTPNWAKQSTQLICRYTQHCPSNTEHTTRELTPQQPAIPNIQGLRMHRWNSNTVPCSLNSHINNTLTHAFFSSIKSSCIAHGSQRFWFL